jgi:hypothetical protein
MSQQYRSGRRVRALPPRLALGGHPVSLDRSATPTPSTSARQNVERNIAHGSPTRTNDGDHRPDQFHPGHHAHASPRRAAAPGHQVGRMRLPCPAKSDASKPSYVKAGSAVDRAKAVTPSGPTRSDPTCGSCSQAPMATMPNRIRKRAPSNGPLASGPGYRTAGRRHREAPVGLRLRKRRN